MTREDWRLLAWIGGPGLVIFAATLAGISLGWLR